MIEHPQYRTLVAVDVQDFSSRRNPAQCAIRTALPDCLAAAFRQAGIDWAGCTYCDRGDGALIVLPPSADTVPVLRPMPELLARAIMKHNGRSLGPARFALRMAVNAGMVHDNPCHTGSTINDTAHMVDAAPLRRALRRTGAALAMLVSGAVYDDLVRHGYAGINPTAYRRCRVSVKRTRTAAWLYVPFAPPGRLHRAALVRRALLSGGG